MLLFWPAWYIDCVKVIGTAQGGCGSWREGTSARVRVASCCVQNPCAWRGVVVLVPCRKGFTRYPESPNVFSMMKTRRDHRNWLVGWLFGVCVCLFGWLLGRSVGRSVGWLVGWCVAAWLVGCLVRRSIGQLVGD